MVAPFFHRLKSVGPGALVAAAFIGPGTVTTSTLAGVQFGYALIWALVFATLATIVLQEMAARLGTVGRVGLGEALRRAFAHSAWRWPVAALVITAILVGNIAYEAGNLSGAALGMQAIFGENTMVFNVGIAIIGVLAALLLGFTNYRQIEVVLVTVVALMALAFVMTTLIVQPDMTQLLSGFVPQMPDGSTLLVVALIGTTVVPYNLFLHSTATKLRYSGPADLGHARFDTSLSIGIGGLIAILVLTTASAALFGSNTVITNAAHMAAQLEPLFGNFAKYSLGFGLFAAGLTSAVAAPLAAGYVTAEILGWEGQAGQRKSRAVAVGVVAAGVLFSLTGIKPIVLIITAQYANGLLLPFIAGFLLLVMNRKAQLGEYVNGFVANCLGGLVLMITTALSLRLVLL